MLGATGMFGSRLLREVIARGAEIRALVHSAAKTDRLVGDGHGEVAVGDLDEPQSLRGAFEGVGTAFLVTPMDDRTATREVNALRAAQEAGVRRLVKLYGANSVMETSLLGQAEAVKFASSMFGCAGDGRVGLVAADDVARAAAVVLTERDEQGVNYELTGPAALTMAEMAAIFSEVLGRRITYQDMPEVEFRKLLVERAGSRSVS
jgi:uncharacterized protein YbjT (DUF2867 family)